MPNEHIDAVGCFLQYLYTGEYFPRRIESKGGAQGGLEEDPSAPSVDDSGEQLLKHARIYTLADKLGIQVSTSLPSPWLLYDNPSRTLPPLTAPSRKHRPSRPSRTPRSIASTALPAAKSPTRASSTRTPRAKTRRSGGRSPPSGLSGRTSCGTRPRRSSSACVWNSRSSASMC